MSFLDRLHPSLRNPGYDEPNWGYFIARYNLEGARWAERYGHLRHVEVLQRTARALHEMRSRRLEAGFQDLEAVKEVLLDVKRDMPDVFHVLSRWYFGALAYYHYCHDDFSGAEECLDTAQEEIRQAIELRSFLVPFASHCFDFWLQRIRIARGQRHWPEMWRRVDIIHQIAKGERPYCQLGNGRAIDLAAVQAFYQALAPFSAEEWQPLQSVFNPAIRQHRLDLELAHVYAIPGFVIPYKPTHQAT